MAPVRRTALTVAKKLNGVVATRSPGRMPAEAIASQRASVPEPHPMASGTPAQTSRRVFELTHRGPENVALICKNIANRCQKFRADLSVLSREVQQRHRLDNG